MWRRRFVLVFVTAVLVVTTGCSCDGYCRNNGPVLELDGTLVERSGSILTFAPIDGGAPVRVGVRGHAGRLDLGAAYSVVAIGGQRTDVQWSTQLNNSCGCDDVNILNLDGTRIDTGWWARTKDAVPFTWIFVIVLVIPVTTLFFVTATRMVRGRDGYDLDDMPFDEWVEYDDPDA